MEHYFLALHKFICYLYARRVMFFAGGFRLKKGIHPEYKKATVTCACGHTFQTFSTVGDINVEICSNCHPFFTGKQKLIDTAGRVEKYRRKYKLEEEKSGTTKEEKQEQKES